MTQQTDISYLKFLFKDNYFILNLSDIVEFLPFKPGDVFYEQTKIPVIDLRCILGQDDFDERIIAQYLIVKYQDKILAFPAEQVINIRNNQQNYTNNFENTDDYTIYKEFDGEMCHFLNLKKISEISFPEHLDTYTVPEEDMLLETRTKSIFLSQLNVHNNDVPESEEITNYLTFLMNKKKYCVDIKAIRNILLFNKKNVTKLPYVPKFVLGVNLYQGEVYTIIDLKSFLNLMSNNVTPERVIIAETNKLNVAFTIGKIFEILPISNNIKIKINNEKDYKYMNKSFKYNNEDYTIIDLVDILESENLSIR